MLITHADIPLITVIVSYIPAALTLRQHAILPTTCLTVFQMNVRIIRDFNLKTIYLLICAMETQWFLCGRKPHFKCCLYNSQGPKDQTYLYIPFKRPVVQWRVLCWVEIVMRGIFFGFHSFVLHSGRLHVNAETVLWVVQSPDEQGIENGNTPSLLLPAHNETDCRVIKLFCQTCSCSLREMK
jgi:hypothetical protein